MEDATSFRSFAERLRTGEDEATRELLARYSARLLALARRRLGGRLAVKADPEDVLQSAFRTFFRRLGAEELELRDWVSLSGLLSLLTLRKCQREAARFAAARRDIRAERPLAGVGDESFAVEVPDREPTPDEIAAFEDLLDRLLSGANDRDRTVVERILAGESVAEIAARLGSSRRTVQRTLVRLRHRLGLLTDPPAAGFLGRPRDGLSPPVADPHSR